MAYDFKKEYKELYMPKNKPQIVDVPEANYIAVRGKGDPNEEGGAYQQAIKVWITLINPPFIGFLLFDYPILYRKKT